MKNNLKDLNMKHGSSNDFYTLLSNDGFKICDMCGNRIDDKVFVVKDENFNIIDGVIQCEDCYKVELY